MAIGYPFSIRGITAGALSAVEDQLGLTLPSGQSFNNLPVVNSKIALYTLRICAPNAPNTPVQTYTFPISPSNFVREYTAMNNIYDVAGSPEQNGVQRIVDEYGNSPVTFLIEGTTGWQRHSTDGFGFTGMESIAALQEALNQYAQLNRAQVLSGIPDLFIMELFDYFYNDFWVVVPVGRQLIRQTSNRPLLFDYSFRLAGVRPIAGAPLDTTPDLVQDALGAASSQVRSTVSQSIGRLLVNYASSTAGELGQQEVAP